MGELCQPENHRQRFSPSHPGRDTGSVLTTGNAISESRIRPALVMGKARSLVPTPVGVVDPSPSPIRQTRPIGKTGRAGANPGTGMRPGAVSSILQPGVGGWR
jgi:hypothetical protein